MHSFSVTVRTLTTRHTYTAAAICSADIVLAAIRRFGLCSVFVQANP